MYNYYYDGSFEGLLTVIFSAFKNKQNINSVSYFLSPYTEQKQLKLDFFNNSTNNIKNSSKYDIYIQTNFKKAKRVRHSICSKISIDFFNHLQLCYLSHNNNKDTIGVISTYRALTFGHNFLNSTDEYAFSIKKLVKNVLSEQHRYSGILRFKEMKDKTLFATIEPKNNILPLIIPHFKNRLQNEKFAIYDKKRNLIAYYNENKHIEIFEVSSLKYFDWSNEEDEYVSLWNIFYNSISIKEKENKKLQKSYLPKYYWRHLVENIEN